MRIDSAHVSRDEFRRVQWGMLGAALAATSCPHLARAQSAPAIAPVTAVIEQPAVASNDASTPASGADELVWHGVAAFDHGDYRAAIASFERASELEPNADLSFNLARSWARLGDCNTAQVHLQRYRDRVTDPPQEFFEGLEVMKFDCPSVAWEREPKSSAPSPELQPKADRVPTVPRHAKRQVEAARDPSSGANPSHATDKRPRDSSSRDVWAYGLFAAGGVSAAAAVVYGLGAADTRHQLETLAQELSADPSRTWDEASPQLITRREHQETLTVSFGVAAAVFESLGLLLFLAPWDNGDRPDTNAAALQALRLGADGRGFWCTYQGAL